MRWYTAPGMVLGLAAVTALGQVRPAQDPSVAARAHTPDTLELLSKRLDDVSFHEAPLERVFDWLDQFTPLNVVVRWQVLEDAGVARDKPITIEVRNLRFSQVLWMLIAEAGGPDLKLAYRAGDGLLIVSSREDLEHEMILRVYDLSDLLARIPRFAGGPQLDFAGASGEAAPAFRAVGSGATGDDPERRPGGDGVGPDPDVVRLIDLVVRSVEPDSWEIHGGAGTVDAFRHLLIVRNTLAVHQALGGYLTE